MPTPVVGFYESIAGGDPGSKVMNGSNPLAFGTVDAGTSSNVPASGLHFPFWIWNDKGGGAGSSTMTSVTLTVKDNGGGDTGQIIVGTPGNGYNPWLEAESVSASGCSPDSQAVYTHIGGTTTLAIGSIPTDACRQIYSRIDAPSDGAPGTINFLFRCAYQYV